ncbi:hypothetical protein BDV12DRAFT_198902 [Aspergillus spectabilis]
MESLDCHEPRMSGPLEPVAIIGMGCRWPGDSESPSALWEFLQEKRTAYGRFPEDRIKTDSFYHPTPGRPGSFYTEGGCFLKSDVQKFDHTFFGINPKEAMSMDPAQRKLLEVVYEAFESSGTSLHRIAGSTTGCFIGNFGYDHQLMNYRDPEYPEPYSVTGGGITLLSNRINYIFDLKGPSLTVDTACSSSMYALHLACSAIRTGECTAAVVGGSNLILTPETQISSCSLGAVSKTSACHTFDVSADGYARADGVAALYIKKLSKAVEDGDPIRAVIRATSINANGRTGGITHPSPEGQEAVIRRAYERAGLDPSLTGYFECHGTGTAVGDPLEVSAIGRVFGSYKSKDAPLLIGSIKTNLGHSEPTSGLAGVMKVVLAIEQGIIPPTVNLRTLNPNLDLQDGRIKIVTESTQWPNLPVRRASVNSFGYGGANAHAIIETVEATRPGYRSRMQAERNGSALIIDNHATTDNKPLDGASQILPKLLLVWSAHDEKTLKANVTALGNVADRWKLTDIAFTLSERRSMLSHRAFVVTDASHVQEELRKGDWIINKIQASSVAKLGFVFTGQGAQWPQMGLNLMARFPSYMASIQRLNGYLDELDDERLWQIQDILHSKDPTFAHTAELSQPLVTALQIGLVNLLREWNIIPCAVVGHSSGEIAAAYAAGLTTERQAMIAAYFRGKAVARNKRQGRMLAVQLTVVEAENYLQHHSDRLVIACYNSPQSLTLSGDAEAIAQLKEQLQSEGRFARILMTDDNAYHSSHMVPLSDWYEEKISVYQAPNTATSPVASLKTATGHDRCPFYSSVYGKEYQTTVIDARYFRQNLESPVKFLQAVNQMVTSTALDAVIEIGPHSMLEGPLRQIRQHIIEGGSQFPEYLPTIIRNSDNSMDLLNLAGKLFIKGYPVNVAQINSMDNLQSGYPYGRTIVDLPPYQWRSTGDLFTENRWSREWRLRSHPRHDILGSRQPGGSRANPVWRNVLRHHDLPWLADHSLGKDAVFPSTGYLCLALEAITQVVEVNGQKATDIESYEFHNVSLQTALIIPGDGGVEILFTMELKPLNRIERFQSRYDFTLRSVVAEKFHEHCRGTIEVLFEPQETPPHPLMEEVGRSAPKTSLDVTQCYQQFASVGLNYGPVFQGLSDVKVVGTEALSEAKITLQPTAKLSLIESRYVIHPAALDTALQLSIVAAHHRQAMRFENAFLPVSFDRIRMYPKASSSITSSAWTLAKAKFMGVRGLTADLAIMGPDERMFVEISNALLIGSDHGIIRPAAKNVRPYARMVWKPDLEGLNQQSLAELYPPTELGDGAVIPLLNDLALHQITEFRASNPQLFTKKSKVPHLQRLLEWIEDKLQLARNDPLSAASDIMAATPEWRKSRILELENQLCPVSPEARLMARLYRSLPAIYSGETTGIEVALQDNLLHNTYEAGQACREGNKRLASILSLLGHKYPSIRILEVGAGTGSATREALSALNGTSSWRQFTEYRFTDTTTSFLARAEVSFQSYDGLSFGVFDMEQSASGQGYSPEWDVVMAANAVHATSDIKNTLCNLRSLLKPGGKLLLLEVMRSQLSAGLLMGTFSDYWKGDHDPEYPRRDGPFLSKAMWRDVLPRTGYDFNFFLDDYAGDNATTTVLCATAVEARLADPLAQPTKKSGLTLVYRDGPSGFPQSLIDHIRSLGIPASGVCLSQVQDLVYARCIFLVELEIPLFQRISPAEWSGLQKCVLFAQSILWVTNGSLIRGREPLFAMISGLARGLQSETTSLRFHILDLDDELCECIEVLKLIVEHEELAATGDLANDTEFRRKDGVTYISRLEQDDALNNNHQVQLSRKATPQHIPLAGLKSTPFRLDIEKPGVLSTVYFRPDLGYSGPIMDDEVEIEVRAVGINNKDIAVLTGSHHANTFSDECAGVITKVGQKVSSLKPGDLVYCLSFARFGNFVRDKAIFCQKMHPRDTFEVCATLPIAFCTAIYGLFKLGRLQRGESVLIQSATGAVGIAACQVANMQGAEIWATVGTVEKKMALLAMGLGIQDDHILYSRDRLSPRKLLEQRGGRGLDVILCSARGELVQEYWSCIAPNGRFIDIGRTEVLEAGTLALDVFRQNATFASFDLELLSKDCPDIIGQLMAETHALYEQDIIQPITHTTYPLSEIDRALTSFTKGAHIGKLVVTYEQDKEAMIRYLHSPFTFTFDPNACYLLVGCLGGLGRVFSRWAVQQGARHLLYLSRSGAASADAKAFVQELQACGVEVQIVQGDVEVLEDVVKAVKQAQYPIKGVVQGALSLNNGLFGSLSLERFQATVGPRVTGTLNLHHTLKDSPLDFFEMWSSWTAIFGTATQSNYLASSAFMDAFARYRRSMGLPGSSLSLSQISGVGVVSHAPRYHHSMFRNGLYGTDESEFLLFCEAGLLSPPTVPEPSAIVPTSTGHLLVGIEPAGLLEVSSEYPLDEMIWSGDARFRNLLQATRLLSTQEEDVTNRRNGNAETAETNSTESIRLRISKLLQVPLEDLEVTRPMKAYGIDIQHASASKANKKGRSNPPRSSCGICDKWFKDENALKDHERNSPKHNAFCLSSIGGRGTIHTARGGNDLEFGFFASANETNGGAQIPKSYQDRPIQSTDAATLGAPARRRNNRRLQGKAATIRSEIESTGNEQAPVAVKEKNVVPVLSTDASSAMTLSPTTTPTAKQEEINMPAERCENTPKVWDSRSFIPLAERERLLNALQEQCHPVDCLSEERYWIQTPTLSDIDERRKCVNCGVTKRKLDDPSKLECRFHPAKRAFARGDLRGRGGKAQNARCFNCQTNGKGCITLPWHQFAMADEKLGNMRQSPRPKPNARKAVVLDCEMVSVLGTNNCEVSEVVTLSAMDFLSGEILVDTFVDPLKKVISWRSKISGVTASLLEEMRRQGRALPGWRAARGALWHFIDEETVLIGHSLNFDLDVLGMVHTRVVDSALVTRDAVGRDCNRFWALKTLAREFLDREIQTGAGGHDCLEDTFAAREVVLWCLRNPDQLQTWAAAQRMIMAEKQKQRERQAAEKALLVEAIFKVTGAD